MSKKSSNKATVIAVANNKGGVAKTTTASAVAYGLARKLYNAKTGESKGRVLIIDLDPQGNQADVFGVRERAGDRCVGDLLLGKTSARDAIISLDRPEDDLHRENLYLLPASRRLEYSTDELSMRRFLRGSNININTVLHDILHPLLGVFRYIVIDCPPKLDLLKNAVYNFADRVIVPVKTDHVSLTGAAQHMADMMELSQQTEFDFPARLTAVVPTMYRSREVLATQVYDSMVNTYRELVTTPIPQAVAVAESSAANGRCIFEYDPKHPASLAYADLVEKVAR